MNLFEHTNYTFDPLYTYKFQMETATMSKVFFSTGISLDGFIAGLNASPTNPLGSERAVLHSILSMTGWRAHCNKRGKSQDEKTSESQAVPRRLNNSLMPGKSKNLKFITRLCSWVKIHLITFYTLR